VTALAFVLAIGAALLLVGMFTDMLLVPFKTVFQASS